MAAHETAADARERRLLTQVGDGDRPAFERFYRICARRVAAFVRDVVASNELADEVTADTMIAVWRSAASFRGQSRVATWILGIAHFKALDALRRANRAHVSLHCLRRNRAGITACDELLRVEERFAWIARCARCRRSTASCCS